MSDDYMYGNNLDDRRGDAERIQTHSEECWRWHGHSKCAKRKVDQLTAEIRQRDKRVAHLCGALNEIAGMTQGTMQRQESVIAIAALKSIGSLALSTASTEHGITHVTKGDVRIDIENNRSTPDNTQDVGDTTKDVGAYEGQSLQSEATSEGQNLPDGRPATPPEIDHS